MNQPDDDRSMDLRVADWFRPLPAYWPIIWKGTLAATALAGVIAAVLVIRIPVTWKAVMEFRPTFQGAERDEYPNGLPFGATDLVANSILEQVIAKNRVHDYCSPDVFRSGLMIQEVSPGLQFLNLEYQSQLAEARLTAIDRQRIQDEYVSRRSALPAQFQVVFIRPADCAKMPPEIVFQAMNDVLATWAEESEAKRGVMRHRIQVLTPAVFNVPQDDMPLMVQLDVTRTLILRVIANIDALDRVPGAEVVRYDAGRLSLAEVRSKLEGLVKAQLEPLAALARQTLGSESQLWMQQALDTAVGELRTAEKRVESYRQALREYSNGSLSSVPTQQSASLPSETSGQATPLFDRSFLDGIVALTTPHVLFRQEMTRRVVEASLAAAEKASALEYYRSLDVMMRSRTGVAVSRELVVKQLAAIIAAAKQSTAQFNQAYDEFSRVAHRIGPAMYTIEAPPTVMTTRTVEPRRYIQMVVVVLVVAPMILSIGVLVWFHARRLLRQHTPA